MEILEPKAIPERMEIPEFLGIQESKE